MKNLSFIIGIVVLLCVSSIAGNAITPDHCMLASGGIFTFLIGLAVFPGISGVVKNEFTEGLCEKVQTSLIQVLKNKAPQLNRTRVGYLEALLSPRNRAGVTAIPVDQGNGKVRSALVKYLQRGCLTDIITEKPDICTSVLEKEPHEQIVSIDAYVGTKVMKFSVDEMRKLCEADAQFMNDTIMAEIDPLIVGLDQLLIAQQAANFGSFNPALMSNLMDLDMLIGARHEPLYYGEKEFLQAFEDINVSERPFAIGAGNLDGYTMQQKIGCCNQLGIDMSQAGNFDYYYDRYVGAILGNSNYFVGMAPGFVQLLTYNQYVGAYAKENDVFSQGVIVDPVTGLSFDMRTNYVICNDEHYNMQFGLWYKLWFVPQNAFAYCDELNGVNGTLEFNARDIADPCCREQV